MKTTTKFTIALFGFIMFVTAVPVFAQIIGFHNILPDGSFDTPPSSLYSDPGTWKMGGWLDEENNTFHLNPYMEMGNKNNASQYITQTVYLGQYFRTDLTLDLDYKISSEEIGCTFDKAEISVVEYDPMTTTYPIVRNEYLLETIPLCTNTNTPTSNAPQNDWQTKSYNFATHPALQGASWPQFSTTIGIVVKVKTDGSVNSIFSLDNVELWAPNSP